MGTGEEKRIDNIRFFLIGEVTMKSSAAERLTAVLLSIFFLEI